MYLIKSSGKTGGQKHSKEADKKKRCDRPLLSYEFTDFFNRFKDILQTSYTDTDKPNIINIIN